MDRRLQLNLSTTVSNVRNYLLPLNRWLNYREVQKKSTLLRIISMNRYGFSGERGTTYSGL